jgi:CBS domain-containing protein
MPQTIGNLLMREVPLLRVDDAVRDASTTVVEAALPALPVVDRDGRYRGIFGERELITALFPGYVAALGGAAFVPKSIDAAIEKRQSCWKDPVERYMNAEHIDVPTDFSDVGLAETFIHHRVLIVPVTDGGSVRGVVTRSEFFQALVERMT